MIDKTLAILAGGKSSRMGYNKALLPLKEKRFIDHIIEAGKDYKEIIIVANDDEPYKNYTLRVVKDIIKGNGPLSGIHSALVNSNTENTLCIACDMPLMSRETLNKLGNMAGEYDVLVPRVEGRLQPLCSIYNRKILKTIEESLLKSENKLQRLIGSFENKVIVEDIKESDFANINTREEYESLEEIKCIQ